MRPFPRRGTGGAGGGLHIKKEFFSRAHFFALSVPGLPGVGNNSWSCTDCRRNTAFLLMFEEIQQGRRGREPDLVCGDGRYGFCSPTIYGKKILQDITRQDSNTFRDSRSRHYHICTRFYPLPDQHPQPPAPAAEKPMKYTVIMASSRIVNDCCSGSPPPWLGIDAV